MKHAIQHLHLWNKSPYPFLYTVTIDRRSDDLRHGRLREYKLNPTRLDRLMKVLQHKNTFIMLGQTGFTLSYIPNNLEYDCVFWDSKSLSK